MTVREGHHLSKRGVLASCTLRYSPYIQLIRNKGGFRFYFGSQGRGMDYILLSQDISLYHFRSAWRRTDSSYAMPSEKSCSSSTATSVFTGLPTEGPAF